jgi:molybdopterin-guanine dinucleotide biosynthesis protein A
MHTIRAVILAGGKARRLGGRDKASLSVGGRTTLQLVREALEGQLGPPLIVARDPERFAEIGLEAIPDIIPGCGPLGGLHAALSAIEEDYALLAACDLPYLDPRVVGRIAARAGEADAVVPRLGGELEPLPGLYARRTVSVAEECLHGDIRKMEWFLDRLGEVLYMYEEAFSGIPDLWRSFVNINTPEDLERVQLEHEGDSHPGAGNTVE